MQNLGERLLLCVSAISAVATRPLRAEDEAMRVVTVLAYEMP